MPWGTMLVQATIDYRHDMFGDIPKAQKSLPKSLAA